MTPPAAPTRHWPGGRPSSWEAWDAAWPGSGLLTDLRQLPAAAGQAEPLPDWMQPAAWAGWAEQVRRRVKPARFEHVCRVAQLAAGLAYADGGDVRRAYAAGILHDIARDLPDSDLLALAPAECDLDRSWPLALHGRAGRALLERLGFGDEAVLQAVADHVTGPRPGDRLAACIYIADVSEPGRGVNDDIRRRAFGDLDGALRQAIVSKVTYLQGRGIAVHPHTLRLFEHMTAGTAATALQEPLRPEQP